MIDLPRSGGSGESNNGNTALRLFKNPEQTAAIIVVEVHLIKKYVVLCTMSSGFMIDGDKLKNYCLATAQLFVQHYPWYNIIPGTTLSLVQHPTELAQNIDT